jgi:hypothetical protein
VQRQDDIGPVSLKDKTGFSIGGLTNDLEKATKMFDDAQPVPDRSVHGVRHAAAPHKSVRLPCPPAQRRIIRFGIRVLPAPR